MNIEIREFQPQEFEGVIKLVQTCYGEAADSPERWRWRHLDFDPKESTMFVAAHEDKVVGVRPMALFDYFLQGQPVKGALFSAVMVHPDYRRLGIFSRLVKACMAEAWRRGAVFINTMPNDISYRGFMKMGWLDPGDRDLFIRPINLEALANQKISPAWLGTSIGVVAQGLVRAIFPGPKECDLDIATVPSFGQEAEDLSRRVGLGFDGLILNRTLPWLTWRYVYNPWNNYERFEARSEDGKLKGYAVTNLEVRWGIATGYIIDLIGENAQSRRALIAAAVERLKMQGAQIAAAVTTTPELLADLRALGFFQVPKRISPKKFHTVYQIQPDYRTKFAAVSSIDRWYQTFGDWDVI